MDVAQVHRRIPLVAGVRFKSLSKDYAAVKRLTEAAHNTP